MKKPSLLLIAIALLLMSNYLNAQCNVPPGAIEYTTGTAMSTGATYKISKGSQFLSTSNLTSGAILYVTGTGSVTISGSNLNYSNVIVCGGGSATVSTAAATTNVNYSNLTVGPNGATTFLLGGPSNIMGFNLGKLNENGIISICPRGPVNAYTVMPGLPQKPWTTYTGQTGGKSYVVVGPTRQFNTSSNVISNLPNVTLIDYGTYTDPAAAPAIPRDGKKFTSDIAGNPFQISLACDPTALLGELEIEEDPPKPGKTIYGSVLEDITNDNTGEKPMSNVIITLKDWATKSIIKQVVTNAIGEYTLTVPDKKKYTVEHAVPTGYTNVTPNPVTVDFSGTTTPIQPANFVNRLANLVCNPAGASGVGEESNVIISTESTARLSDLKKIKNGQLVLDSDVLGLNLPNISSSTAITTPVEGMIFFDTTARCIKLYQNSKWGCLQMKNCVQKK